MAVDLFLPYAGLASSRTPSTGEFAARDSLDDHFGAYPVRVRCGTSATVARDAIIDLLSLSATTFSWRFGCFPRGNSCILSLVELQVLVPNPDGSRTNRMVLYDRCGACERLKNRPDTSRPAEFVPVVPR